MPVSSAGGTPIKPAVTVKPPSAPASAAAPSTPAPASSAPQLIQLGGKQLNSSTPFEVPSIDRGRPIAFVEALSTDGKPVTVTVGTEVQPAGKPYDKPLFGDLLLTGDGKISGVKITYGDATQSNIDSFSINPAKQGLHDGQEMRLPLPAVRAGRDIENIEVSYHAPVRQWNNATGREEKPTYSDWFVDDRHLQHKFIDPNVDNGNAPEIDNIYPSNPDAPGSLGPAGQAVRIVAESKAIPSSEEAMTVQWVRVTYKPTDTEVKTQTWKGEALPNNEWKGKWISAGDKFQLDVEPGREIERVEVHWSDKPDDYGYEQPGKWAVGTLLLDGKPLGSEREHVGSPAWQFFEGGSAKGSKLELYAQDSDIKLFDVNIHYKKK